MSIKLFGDIQRTDTDIARYSDSGYEYLNRSGRRYAGQVRDALEGWFARYPAQGAADLCGRFTSRSDIHHKSAFFELLLHELALCHGYSATPHPDIPGKTTHPEFLLERAGSSFYLEAAVVTCQTTEQVAEDARIAQAYDALNRFDSPDYWVLIHDVEGAPQSSVPARLLKRFIRKEMSKLNYDEVVAGSDDRPDLEWEHDGWRISFGLLPKGDARGIPGVRPLGGYATPMIEIKDRAAMLAALTRKAGHYGRLDKPLVVAINVTSSHTGMEDVVDALFGERVIAVGPDHATRTKRRQNGLWTGASPYGPRVSGVLVFLDAGLYTYPTTKTCLFVHPEHTDTAALLELLPQRELRGGSLVLTPGKTIGELVGQLDTGLLDD